LVFVASSVVLNSAKSRKETQPWNEWVSNERSSCFL